MSVCKSGQTKTGIVYKCNLNFTLINKYLSLLKAGGLLEEVKNTNGSRLYRTTDKGTRVLLELEHIQETIFSNMSIQVAP